MVETTSKTDKKEDKGFMSWLSEDDAPEIGMAVKESYPEYFEGVAYEFKRINWPTKEQAGREFVTVIVIVAIITLAVYAIDLGLDKVIALLKGVAA
jgi:preprotein translocase SecE subunit